MCDACMHAILCGGWLCKACGREFCFDCFEVLEEHQAGESPAASGSASSTTAAGGNRTRPPPIAERTFDKLEACLDQSSMPTYAPGSFIPVARIDRSELDRIARAMEVWKHLDSPPPPKRLPPGWLDQYRVQPTESENSLPYLCIPGTILPPRDEKDFERSALPLLPQSSRDPRALAPHQPSTSSSSLTSSVSPPLDSTPIELSRSIWSLGEALVVDVSTAPHSGIQWTPQYFIDRFGDESCTIESSNVPGEERPGTVREFFERFEGTGKAGDSEKIRDWPRTDDFKNAYPELWHDFMDRVPVGSVTRRDSVLNISSHTPHNANPPDLGPKGYFSQTSDDSKGGMGSTKLHTVNILLWASEDPLGQAGFAVWDLFRAEDSEKIRDFLYEIIAKQGGYRDTAEARSKHDDPIHEQTFFIDCALRKRLWEEKGVKSWRVHQRPGQAVFIPAGCAHQVCNFANCIKVASDFVSIENVAQCWTVTDKFRQQTKGLELWRSDVLQLKSQLLWAWHWVLLSRAPSSSSPRSTPSGLNYGITAQPDMPAPPSQLTACPKRLKAKVERFDAVCATVEQRVLRAIAVLERDARKAAGISPLPAPSPSSVVPPPPPANSSLFSTEPAPPPTLPAQTEAPPPLPPASSATENLPMELDLTLSPSPPPAAEPTPPAMEHLPNEWLGI
ncbi:hypothetical protein JCM1840_000542 [Sporobolomyces johnsonii]